jgi:hypothetical protein
MVTTFAPGVIGSEQTWMGKSPPGADRVRIGTATLSIVAAGHCALSVMARASRPPGTYWTQRASSAPAAAVDIVTVNMPNTTARVVRCMNFPKPFAILRADKHGALAHRNHNHGLARMLPNCRAPALPGEPRPNRDYAALGPSGSKLSATPLMQ